MNLNAIHTENAPKAIGPYSQAIRAGNLLFVSGQLPLDLETMKIIEGGTVEQARLVLKHIGAILHQAGLDFKNVAKVEIFLQSMDDFKAVNEVYKEFFVHDPKPARQAFEVAKLPLNAKIEISCIAAL